MTNSNERLRHQLEVQSIQIEQFLTRHDVPAEVAGGTVRSRWVNFDLNTQISAGLDKLRHLGTELASTLGASDVSITQQDDRLRIAVKQPKTHPVDLLDLMEALPENEPMTATLGLDVADRPVLLNLLADDIVNILVAGEREAGKTALLRTFALSLALQNKQSQVQMAILDVGSHREASKNKPTLYPLNYLPHVMFNIVENFREAAEALTFLVSEANYRIEQDVEWPLLVLIIDNVDYLVEMGGQPIIESLTYLLEEGENAGMRIVLGASNPESVVLRPLLKNSMPVRLVGKVANSTSARAIAGVQDSQAEYLMGKGDFIAVSNSMVLPFQAAYISDYDLHLILDKLHRQSQPVILAQPMMIRPTTVSSVEETEEAHVFDFNSHDGRANVRPAGKSGLNLGKPTLIESSASLTEVTRLDYGRNEIEEADWEEIEEDEDDWQDDNGAVEVVDVWAEMKQKPGRSVKSNDIKSRKDEDAPIEVWSKANNEQQENRLSSSFDEEIEFEWE